MDTMYRFYVGLLAKNLTIGLVFTALLTLMIFAGIYLYPYWWAVISGLIVLGFQLFAMLVGSVANSMARRYTSTPAQKR